MYLNSHEILTNSHENSQIRIPGEVVTIAAKTMVTQKSIALSITLAHQT